MTMNFKAVAVFADFISLWDNETPTSYIGMWWQFTLTVFKLKTENLYIYLVHALLLASVIESNTV